MNMNNYSTELSYDSGELQRIITLLSENFIDATKIAVSQGRGVVDRVVVSWARGYRVAGSGL